jgi:hypothetical protein
MFHPNDERYLAAMTQNDLGNGYLIIVMGSRL